MSEKFETIEAEIICANNRLEFLKKQEKSADDAYNSLKDRYLSESNDLLNKIRIKHQEIDKEISGRKLEKIISILSTLLDIKENAKT